MSTNELDRASRASRGKRMWKLLDEEVEADDEFWNQEAFREDAEDNEYATEDEEADIFDSDFDEDEPDEELDIEEDERQRTKKRNLPPGTYYEKKKKTSSLTKEGVFHVSIAAGCDMSDSVVPLPNVRQVSHHQEYGESILDTDGERSVRKSTRTAVVIKQAEREAHQAALLALSKVASLNQREWTGCTRLLL